MVGWVTLSLLLLLLLNFIQDTYLAETNHVSTVYNIAAVLWLQLKYFQLHLLFLVTLFFISYML
jgi:hypothetical protein